MLARLDRVELAIGALQVGRQQFVEVADDNQGHVVGRVPMLAQGLQLIAGQVVDLRTFGAFEPQFDGQLVAGGVAKVLAVEQALQV